MIDLQATAPATGGRVVVLWGNHEAINLTVDLLDVSAEALATFVDGRSEERRHAALAAWRASLAEPPDAVAEAAWQAQHPPGIFAYVDALGPDGTYGQWLRQQTLVARVGDTLFVDVCLDPVNPPREVMVQWNSGAWEHRAYWGENLIAWGVNGTASRR